MLCASTPGEFKGRSVPGGSRGESRPKSLRFDPRLLRHLAEAVAPQGEALGAAPAFVVLAKRGPGYETPGEASNAPRRHRAGEIGPALIQTRDPAFAHLDEPRRVVERDVVIAACDFGYLHLRRKFFHLRDDLRRNALAAIASHEQRGDPDVRPAGNQVPGDAARIYVAIDLIAP